MALCSDCGKPKRDKENKRNGMCAKCYKKDKDLFKEGIKYAKHV